MKPVFCLMMMVIFSVLGCKPVKIAVSDELKQNSDEYAVKGRQGLLIKQKLAFGEFRTNVVKRSWTKGSSMHTGFGFGYPGRYDQTNIFSIDYSNKRQTIFFSLQDGNQNASEVYCTSRFNARDFSLGNNPNSILNIVLDVLGKGGSSEDNYYVQIYTAPNEKPWQMMIDNQAAQAQPKKYTGVLAKDAHHFYTIKPVTKLDVGGKTGNMLGGSSGFEFLNEKGIPAGAVSLIDNGIVVIGKVSAEERFLLANACAALLLQEHIE